MLRSTNTSATATLAPGNALAVDEREARALADFTVERALVRLARGGALVELRQLAREVLGVAGVSLRRLHRALVHLERVGRVELLPRPSTEPVALGDAAVAIVDGRRGLLVRVRVLS